MTIQIIIISAFILATIIYLIIRKKSKMELDPATQMRLKFLDENYIPLVDYHLNQEGKIFLGDKDNKKCRFCGKSEPETTFSNVSHAIPEFTGNKKLIAYNECDVCNSKFSKLLENHMANYMNLLHTFSQVRGKKGVPSFKTIHNKKSRVDVGSTNVEVENHEGDSIATIDEINKTITFTAKKASYVPIAIYKCLTKMALTIMPENELDNFKTTMKWINEEDHAASHLDLKALFALMSFAPGAIPYPFTSCMLFKRKDNPTEDVPYMLFLLAYGNFAFQIYLPLSSEDKKYQGSNFEMVFIPTPIDMLQGTGVLTRKKLDLNSKTLVKGEDGTIVLQFDSFTELPIPNPPTEP
jgi:hypothetical protein